MPEAAKPNTKSEEAAAKAAEEEKTTAQAKLQKQLEEADKPAPAPKPDPVATKPEPTIAEQPTPEPEETNVVELRESRPAKLKEHRMDLAEYKRNVFQVVPDAGALPEDLLEPEYWTHVARKLKPGDIIEAISEDSTWEAEYRVLYSDRSQAKMSLRWSTKLEKVNPEDMSDGRHHVEYKGAVDKWCVISKKNNQTVRGGFVQSSEAILWMAQNAVMYSR